MAFPEWVNQQTDKLGAMEVLFEAIVAEAEHECTHCNSEDIAQVVVTAGGAVAVCEGCAG